jgi:hypothetical protein
MATAFSRAEDVVQSDVPSATTFSSLYECDETLIRYGLDGFEKGTNILLYFAAMLLESTFRLRIEKNGMISGLEVW